MFMKRMSLLLTALWPRSVRLPALLMATLSVALALSPPLHAAEPACRIVIGSCHRPPLSTATGAGIIDRVAIEAFRRVGVSACIEALPCERSLLNADMGVTDGDILRVPGVVTGKYPNLLVVPEVLYALPISGFYSRPALQVKGLGDLAKLRVGYVLGWKILDEQVRAAEILRVRGPDELFPLLLEDKADIVIYERITGLHMLKEQGLTGIRALDPVLLHTPQHLVLHRRHQHLAEPLAAAIRAIKADGSYAAAFRQAGYPVPVTK